MENFSEHRPASLPIGINTLPADRKLWPSDADAARESLIRELNRWSRDNDWPATLNSWVAEEAIRRGF